MDNPLTSLDELIWKQFGKVTVLANKNLGLDKYDLAEKTLFSAAIALTGWATYVALYGVLTQNNLDVLAGFGACTAGYFLQKNVKGELKEEREKELERIVVLGGAIAPPDFNFVRPVILGISLSTLALGINYLVHKKLLFPIDTKLSLEKEAILRGSIAICTGVYYASGVATRYFITQPPSPPSTKKSLWRLFSEYVIGQHQEPASEPPPAKTS